MKAEADSKAELTISQLVWDFYNENGDEGNPSIDWKSSMDPLFEKLSTKNEEAHLAMLFYSSLGCSEEVKRCVEQLHCHVNYTIGTFGTPLNNAISSGGRELISYLLSLKEIDISGIDAYFNETPLIMAARMGDVDSIQQLIIRDPDLYVQSYLHGTALTAAIYNKERDVVQKLLNKETAGTINEKHPGALLCAIHRGDLGILKMLLEKNIDINTYGNVNYEEPPQYIKEGVYDSPFITRSGSFFELPVIAAMKHNNLGALSLLLHYNADISKKGMMSDHSAEDWLSKGLPLSEEVKAMLSQHIEAMDRRVTLTR